MDALSPEKLKSQIALLEELLREKREALKVAVAAELFCRKIAGLICH
jgi:hypothetical protein